MALLSDVPLSGENENPLLWPILEILQVEPSGWKVHTLSSRLSEQGYLHRLDSSPEKELFKRNFLIMNALYQLQEVVYPEHRLCVDAMNISLAHSGEPAHHSVDIRDPLREYYLDWRHYEADEEEIRSLLSKFWQTYQRFVSGEVTTNMSRAKALQLFDLDNNATRVEIRKQWRKLAFRWHPDRKNGNSAYFKVLCEAWSVLRR